MNNRPLFGAVMCFALGEVIYIIAGKGNQISTAIVVLICVALIVCKLKLTGWKKVIYIGMCMLGLANICCAQKGYVGNVLFGGGEYGEKIELYDNYTIGYMVKEQGDGNTARDARVYGIGVVDNIAQGNNGLNVTVKLHESKTDYSIIYRDYKVIIYGVERKVEIGDAVILDGHICEFVPSGNPGEFNRRIYYKARGIVGYGDTKNLELITDFEGDEDYDLGFFEEWLYAAKRHMYNLREDLSVMLYSICDEKSAGLYAGILLGDKHTISHESLLLYRISGIAHIFAISGLHIGIIGGLLYKLLRKIGLKFLPGAMLAMMVTIMYGVMTGFSFSTIRAIIMLGISLGGEVLGRRYDMLTGMGVALFAIIVMEPFRIMDGGLILSFAAVSGVAVSKYIVKLMGKYEWFRRLQKKKYRRIYGIVSGMIFSMGISLVTTPLVAYMYFQIPLYSVFINVIILPLMTITVFCGFFGVLVGFVSMAIGKVIIFPGVLSLKLYKWVCIAFQSLPMDIINTGKPDVMELIIYYLVLINVLVGINPDVISWIRNAFHTRSKKWISYTFIKRVCGFVMIFITILGVIGVGVIRLGKDKEFITFLDVGQGDGVLIETPDGIHIAVDVGSASNDNLGEYVAYPAMLTEFDGRVDYWFITHFDKDHTSGLEYILNSDIDMGITIGNLVVSENSLALEDAALIQAAIDKGINIICVKQGDYIRGKNFAIRCIHPDGAFDKDDRNEQSLVLSYQSNNLKLLLTGDVGEEAIKHMLEQGALESDYDVLKVPHHGSKYSYSRDFLQQINVETAVISCASHNERTTKMIQA